MRALLNVFFLHMISPLHADTIPLEAQTPALQKIYYMELSGDPQLAGQLLKDLSSKDCQTLPTTSEARGALINNTCHAFRPYADETQIKNVKASEPQTFLYRVRIDSPHTFNLQIYKRDGAKLRRIANGGDFKPKKDFYENLRDSTIKFTFK